MGAGGITSVIRACLNDTHKDIALTRAISYLAMNASLISMVALILGGFIFHFISWRAIF